MQSKSLIIMAGLLALQAGLAAALLLGGDGEAVTPEPLLSLDTGRVQSIKVASSETSVQLARAGERWQLEGGLPADSERVDRLLHSLGELETGWPVADTEPARERMEVAEDKFRAQLTLSVADGESAVVYLGTAPSFRQTHVRRAGEEEVYALNFDGYSAATSRDQWLDTALLRPTGEIKQIQAGDFSLARTAEGGWPAALEAAVPDAAPAADAGEQPAEVVVGAADTQTQTEAITKAETGQPTQGDGEPEVAASPPAVKFDPKTFAETLNSLTVLGEAGANADLDRAGDGVARFTFTVVADSEHRYELIKADDEYYLKRDDYPAAFRLSQYQYDQLTALKQYLDVAQG